MGTCQICDNTSLEISGALGLCADCILLYPERARKIALGVHARSRKKWGLPGSPPRDPEGIACNLCVNQCRISEGEWGYCGLRHNKGGVMRGVSFKRGNLSWYYDPLPTNCVGDWICPGGTGCGFPQYANCEGAEYGFDNLAVFCHACTFNCLYCQNWQFRDQTHQSPVIKSADIVNALTTKTACICYFGGDPAPQLPFLLNTSKNALNKRGDRILRICWETNGSMSKHVLADLVDSALHTGGCIKFDLKAWDETLHIVLTGVTNRQTLKNFKRIADRISERQVPPLLIASTLMVPGYVGAIEVGRIAAFIKELDPNIPYSLLAFHPQHEMRDLAPTSRKQAECCINAAHKAGLKRVRIGNEHLLY
jgi:pyruvate formate lyase activating enzyme